MGATQKVIATVHNTDGFAFNLYRGHMEGVFSDAGYTLRSTRRQIAKAVTLVNVTKRKLARGEEKIGKYIYALVRYTCHVPGQETTNADVYGRASARSVVVGCQTFRGKDAQVLREWASA